MATTKASQRAVNKYVKNNYDRINVTMEKGNKDLIKAHAEKYDKGSVNAFINRAIEETMERDNKTDPEAILTAFNKMEEAGYRLTPYGREYKRKLQETAAPSTLTEQKKALEDMATELGYEVIEKGTPLEEAAAIYTDTPEALPENIDREKVKTAAPDTEMSELDDIIKDTINNSTLSERTKEALLNDLSKFTDKVEKLFFLSEIENLISETEITKKTLLNLKEHRKHKKEDA